jgi:hypothetical protein
MIGTRRSVSAVGGVLAIAVMGVLAGCTEDAGGSDSPDCTPVRDTFLDEAWAPVLGRTCVRCHAPGGQAQENGASFVLLPAGYPGFVETNIAMVREMSRLSYDGQPVILMKPTARMPHGGGEVFAADSAEYAALERFVRRLQEEETCTQPEGNVVADVTLLPPEETLRKATLHFAGRLPTEDERASVAEGGEEALEGALRGFMSEAAFYDRIRELFNDYLLTDRYLSYRGHSIGQLSESDFPGRTSEGYYGTLTDEEKDLATRAVGREPLELIVHVIKENRPFSEIVTADYIMVNPYSARVYGTDTLFTDPTDEKDFREARVTFERDGERIEIPHSGVLTSPMFLSRFPTTPTNRNRHRARKVYELFLATDILKVADRPINPEDATLYVNPTRDDPTCNVCHRQLDPIAGVFQKWDERSQARYMPTTNWYRDMIPAGFNEEVMPLNEANYALAWLGIRIADDPRFSLSMTHLVYRAMTGREPLSYPVDPEDPDFATKLAAWKVQDSLLRDVANAFAIDGLDFRTLLARMLMSPLYRATGTSATDPVRLAALSELGTSRLSTPERLARKLEALSGVRWQRYDGRHALDTDYRVLYGGIDSSSVTQRLTQPNGIMANVQWRAANAVSCRATAWDFTKPQASRALFPHVAVEDAPETPAGDETPAAVERIKRNIQYLHERILGERLAADDPEIERTYGLFLETLREGRARITAEDESGDLVWDCRGRWNRDTGEELPEGERVERDRDYIVRSWMAVITYLLSDYRHLYE